MDEGDGKLPAGRAKMGTGVTTAPRGQPLAQTTAHQPFETPPRVRHGPGGVLLFVRTKYLVGSPFAVRLRTDAALEQYGYSQKQVADCRSVVLLEKQIPAVILSWPI